MGGEVSYEVTAEVELHTWVSGLDSSEEATRRSRGQGAELPRESKSEQSKERTFKILH